MAAKETAWKWFSKYIRTKECFETTGNFEAGRCCTCGRYYPISDLDAGHFIPGRRDNILFDEDIVHIQCYKCNRTLHRMTSNAGRYDNYLTYMLDRYGIEKVQEIRQRKWAHKKYSESDYKEIGKYYKKKYEEFIKNNE